MTIDVEEDSRKENRLHIVLGVFILFVQCGEAYPSGGALCGCLRHFAANTSVALRVDGALSWTALLVVVGGVVDLGRVDSGSLLHVWRGVVLILVHHTTDRAWLWEHEWLGDWRIHHAMAVRRAVGVGSN